MDDRCKDCLYYVENPSHNGKDICDSEEPCFHGDEFKSVYEKKVIGVDLANANISDLTAINVSFRNNGKYDQSAVNAPILHNEKAVGIITKVTDGLVCGYVFDAKFYQEFLGSVCCGVSFKIAKENSNK